MVYLTYDVYKEDPNLRTRGTDRIDNVRIHEDRG